jgi:CRP-like cAMP-binding protein
MHAHVVASESTGSSLFIVQSGSLRVTVENDGACRQLAVFQKGACVLGWGE